MNITEMEKLVKIKVWKAIHFISLYQKVLAKLPEYLVRVTITSENSHYLNIWISETNDLLIMICKMYISAVAV